MHIFHSRWHQLTDEHIESLFRQYLGDTLTVFPFAILPQLKKLEVATLEVLRDSAMSSVYHIRETGEVYQLMKSGKVYGPFNILDYQPTNEGNGVKVSYKSKPSPFIVSEDQGEHFLTRTKSPRFKASYDPVTKEIKEITWIDPEPNQVTLISTLKKANRFLMERVK